MALGLGWLARVEGSRDPFWVLQDTRLEECTPARSRKTDFG